MIDRRSGTEATVIEGLHLAPGRNIKARHVSGIYAKRKTITVGAIIWIYVRSITKTKDGYAKWLIAIAAETFSPD